MDNEPTIKSVTTRLPIELYEEFAIAARRRKIPIKDAFEQAIRALARHNSTVAALHRQATRSDRTNSL
jgi:hypothetical protein